MLVSALAWAGADSLVDLEVSPRGGCGRTAAGAVRCWSHDEEVARPVEGVDARRGLMVAPSQAFACAVGAAPGVSCWGPAAGGLELGPLAAATAVLPIRYGDDVCARVAEGVRCVWNGGFSWVSEAERLSREGPHGFDALGRIQVVSLTPAGQRTADGTGVADMIPRLVYVPCGNPTTIGVYDTSGTLVRSILVDRHVSDVAPTRDGAFLYLASGAGPQRLARQAGGGYAVDATWAPERYAIFYNRFPITA